MFLNVQILMSLLMMRMNVRNVQMNVQHVKKVQITVSIPQFVKQIIIIKKVTVFRIVDKTGI